jgi:hypothetical protein
MTVNSDLETASNTANGTTQDFPYDLAGNTLINSGTAANATDVPNLVQVQGLIVGGAAPALAGANGSSFVGFLQSGTGAVARTVQDKLRDTVHAKDFGVVANGSTDDYAAMQKAITYAAGLEAELHLPPGDIYLSAGLVHNAGALCIRGSEAGSQGTRLLNKANTPCITISAQCTIENIGVIGENNPAKTNQAGMLLTDGTQNVYVRSVTFDGCYDSIQLVDTVFFCYFEKIRWFSSVRNHVRGTGTSAPGYAVAFIQCQGTSPTQNGDCLYFENAGSLVFADCAFSPATATGRCLRLVSNASLSGIHQFSNTVFEGSVLEAVRIEGSTFAPIKYCYFSNCYFNQSGTGADAVTLVYVDGIHFTNSYFSGTGAAMSFAGNVKRLNVVNADLPGGGSVAMFRALPGATIDGVTLANINYTGANRIFDSSVVSAGNVLRVTISGGRIGTHASPINVNVADASQIRCTAVGSTQTRNGGIATFNGGVSLFAIPHGLLGTPTKFYAVSNSPDAGNAEVREVTVDSSNVYVQCKAGATAGTNNVKWSWSAEV